MGMMLGRRIPRFISVRGERPLTNEEIRFISKEKPFRDGIRDLRQSRKREFAQHTVFSRDFGTISKLDLGLSIDARGRIIAETSLQKAIDELQRREVLARQGGQSIIRLQPHKRLMA